MLAARLANPRRRRHGFTMIELIIVLVVLSVILAMAAPNLRGWGRGAKLNDAARQLLATAHWARSEAIATATTHRLTLDPASNSYLVYRQDGTAYTPVVGDFGKANPLPTGFRLQLVSGGVDGTGIEFYSNARSTPAVVRIISPDGQTSDIASNFPADLIHIVTNANGGGAR